MNLQELKRLALAATRGPWEAYFAFGSSDLPCEIRNDVDNTIVVWDESCDGCCTADARYIVAVSPEKILSLISDLETCIEALEYYGEISSYHTIIETDLGERARAALGKTKE